MTTAYEGPRWLEDPRAMRALAHPLRLSLLEQLTLRGPMTATQCAARVGESPSSCSFHLRMLAKYGFVEEAEGGTGRERPWQAASIGSAWETGPGTPVAQRAAGEALSALVREHDLRTFEAYLARADEFEPTWSGAVVQANYGSYLTPEELAGVQAGLHALWEPYVERLAGGERPPGARLVHMSALAFPRADSLEDDPPSTGDGDD